MCGTEVDLIHRREIKNSDRRIEGDDPRLDETEKEIEEMK